MPSKKLLDKLNDAISREVLVSVQYMWQHVTVRGINAESLGGVLKDIAITEMKHGEAIAERLDYLGGVPTTLPLKKAICIGRTVKEILEIDKPENFFENPHNEISVNSLVGNCSLN